MTAAVVVGPTVLGHLRWGQLSSATCGGANCLRPVLARKKARKSLGCDFWRWPGKGCGLPSFRDETAKGTGLFVCSKTDSKKVLRGALCASADEDVRATAGQEAGVTLRVALLSYWKHHALRGLILRKEIDVRLRCFLELRLCVSVVFWSEDACSGAIAGENRSGASSLVRCYLAALAAPNSSL
jgi:hypothetical protein